MIKYFKLASSSLCPCALASLADPRVSPFAIRSCKSSSVFPLPHLSCPSTTKLNCDRLLLSIGKMPCKSSPLSSTMWSLSLKATSKNTLKIPNQSKNSGTCSGICGWMTLSQTASVEDFSKRTLESLLGHSYPEISSTVPLAWKKRYSATATLFQQS